MSKLKKVKNQFTPKQNDIINWPIPLLLEEHKLIREKRSKLPKALREFINYRVQYFIKEGVISDYELLPFVNAIYSTVGIICTVPVILSKWVNDFGIKIFGSNNYFSTIKEESNFDKSEFDIVVDITKTNYFQLDKE